MNNILFDLLEDSQFVDIMNNDVIEEGEQADAYKARKEREKKEAEAKEKEREERRYGSAGNHVKHYENHPGDKKEKLNHTINQSAKQGSAIHRDMREWDRRMSKELATRNDGTPESKEAKKHAMNMAANRSARLDAGARHARRHPNKESYLGINIE